MQKKCINCHFLTKEADGHKNTVNADERKKALNGNNEFINTNYSLNCYMGVWDEGVFNDNNRINRIAKSKRLNCFFYPHQPDMLFKAAMELQKRDQEHKELKRSYLYTRIGLLLATGSLLVMSLVEWLKFKYAT